MELDVGVVYKSVIKVELNGDVIQDDWFVFVVLEKKNYYAIKILDCNCKSYKEGDRLVLFRFALIITNARPYTDEDEMVNSKIQHTSELIENFIDMALQTKDEKWFHRLMALKEDLNAKLR
jgi:hypothetical protein